MQIIARHLKGAGCRLALCGAVLACGAAAAQPPADSDSDLDALLAEQSPEPAPAETSTAPESTTAEASPPPATAEAAPTVAETLPVQELPTTEEPARKEAVRDRSRRIEEIIVTATKRESSIRDIPASIAAFDGQKLEAEGKVGLLDYLEETPGVTADSIAPGVIRVSMRGISVDTAPASGQPPPTGIFIGDTSFADPYVNGIVPDLSAFDLSSVEVLKGPQGTLFGGTALSGAIRFVPQAPVFGEWAARAFTQYTDYAHGDNAFTSGVAINAPLYSDRLALRAVYVKRGYPGLYDNTREPVQKDIDSGGGEQLRGILSWQPLEALNIKLTHIQQDFSGDNVSSNADNPERYEKGRSVLPQPVQNDFTLDSLELAYDFSQVRAVSLTSLSTKHLFFSSDLTSAIAGSPPAGTPPEATYFGSVLDDSEAIAQEFRVQSSGDGSFQWLAGIYLYNYKVFFEQLLDSTSVRDGVAAGEDIDALLAAVGLGVDLASLANESSLLYAVADVKARERALFFDATQTFWKDFDLSLGARLYSTTVVGGFSGSGVLARAQNNGMNINNEDSKLTEKGVNPKISATWRFGEENSLYALATRGFRFGGIQSVPSSPTNGVPEVYKSDTIWNYELGVRTSWLDGSLQADLTGFYIDYKNPQIPQTTQGVPLGYTDNIGAAVSQGFEASLLWRPFQIMTVSLAGGLTDARTTVPFTASNGDEVPAGTQLPGAAKTQVSSSVGLFLPLGEIIVAPRLDYVYVGKGYGDINHNYEINNFGILNGGIGFTSKAFKVKPLLALNVANIFGITRVKGGAPGNALNGTRNDSYLLNAPRTFTARFSLDF
ncbi:MAG: TonB-dependent receptor [Pseudomonadota bacterium]